jgi:hypothetical protein
VLRRKHPGRVRLRNLDRLMLVWLCRLIPALLDAILIVQPETVLRWHRRGFRAYWHWRSRNPGGRPRIDPELRALIRRCLGRSNFVALGTNSKRSTAVFIGHFDCCPVPRAHAVALSGEEQTLYNMGFGSLRPREFISLLMAGEWKSAAPGDTVLTEGKPLLPVPRITSFCGIPGQAQSRTKQTKRQRRRY